MPYFLLSYICKVVVHFVLLSYIRKWGYISTYISVVTILCLNNKNYCLNKDLNIVKQDSVTL